MISTAPVTARGANTYAYDADSRLTGANAAGGAALSYDPAGRLYELSLGGARTQFLYDGGQLAAEYVVPNGLTRRHIPGAGVDETLATLDGAGLTHILADVRGTPMALVAPNGAVDVERYGVFGEEDPGNLGRFGFTGQMRIPELGLFYYKNRFYDPKTGRFLTPDPLGYVDGPNLYAYVLNDPVNNVDPSGLQTCYAITATIQSTGESFQFTHCFEQDYGASFSGTYTRSGGFVPDIVVTAPRPSFGGFAPGPNLDFGGGAELPGGSTGDIVVPAPMMMEVAFTGVCPLGENAGESSLPNIGARGLLRVLGIVGAILSLSGDTPRHPLFRVVGSAELTSIISTGEFSFAPGGMEIKEFWYALGDARWYAAASANWPPAPAAIVSTFVSPGTLALGTTMQLDNRSAVAFDSAALPALNRDARENGIQVVAQC